MKANKHSNSSRFWLFQWYFQSAAGCIKLFGLGMDETEREAWLHALVYWTLGFGLLTLALPPLVLGMGHVNFMMGLVGIAHVLFHVLGGLGHALYPNKH